MLSSLSHGNNIKKHNSFLKTTVLNKTELRTPKIKGRLLRKHKDSIEKFLIHHKNFNNNFLKLKDEKM